MEYIAVLMSVCTLIFNYSTTNAADTNIALGKIVTRSSAFPHGGWGQDNAVDGVVDQINHNNCDCCSATKLQTDPWFRVDLGGMYIVSGFSVYTRDYNTETFNLTEIYFHILENFTGLPQTTIRENVISYNHTFASPIEARYVTVKYKGYRLFVLCEVEVYGECQDGNFGFTCGSVCHCEGPPCNKISGVCPSGTCLAGYRGEKCDIECVSGTYGQNCSEDCGNCWDNDTCHHVNGSCIACDAGYMGTTCKEACPSGTYGLNCSETCGNCYNMETCGHVDGTCTSCEAGYMGNKCMDECISGTYGQNCSENCGYCRDNDTCHHVNGSCTACDAGYTGTTCKEDCPAGTYGENCTGHCGHCRNNESCHHVNGLCQLCSDGYTGVFCNQTCPSRAYGLNCSETCGNCYNMEVCGHVDGTCTRCEAGYRGNKCMEVCESGQYGLNCASQCGSCAEGPCDHVTGICSNCSAGFLTQFCNKRCPSGTYGLNCSEKCVNCYNMETCGHVDGTCTRCEAGYRGNKCKEKCISGTYGQNCSEHCGQCMNNDTCHHINGSCTACNAGYKGKTCKQMDTEGRQEGDSGSLQTPLIGVIAGVLVLVLVSACIFGFVLIRRRRQNTTKQDENVQTSYRESDLMQIGLENNYSTIFDDHITCDETSPSNNMTDNDEQKEKEDLPIKNHQKGSAKKLLAHTNDKKQASHEYYSFLPKNVKISELLHYISTKKSKKCEYFYKEYKMFKDGLIAKHGVAEAAENKGKTRYKGLYAYDHSRVKLVVEGAGETDYINASYIHGYDKPNKFIASQGPTKVMINDFWRMLWQQKTEMVVMLTNLFEMGANKCEQYWPEGEDGAVTSFGSIEVKLLKTEVYTDYDIRRLEMKKSSVYTNDDCPALPVTQYHFKAWPDKDVPDTTWCLVNFLRVVDRAFVQKTPKSPIVVHCSAGIGRTGTFIALDNLYYQAMTEGSVNPYNIVSKLRDQRVKMVQTVEQYVYLHEALADSLLIGSHFVWTSQMEEISVFMEQPFSNSKMTNYDQQFKRLKENTVREFEDSEYCNMDEEPKHESQPLQVRPKYQVAEFFQTLSAYYLPILSVENGLIITKTPNTNTMTEFWTMVIEKNVKTIILAEPGLEDMFPQKDTAEIVLDNGTIKYTSEKIFDSFITRTLTLEPTRRIGHYTFTAWDDGKDVPRDTASIVDILNHVTKWQPQPNQKEPVVVCCRDGTTRSGLISVLLNEFVRKVSTGNKVNIIETIHSMKDVNPDIITSSVQLKHCYDAILCSLNCVYKNDDVYENV